MLISVSYRILKYCNKEAISTLCVCRFSNKINLNYLESKFCPLTKVINSMVLGQMKMHLKYPLPIPEGPTFSCRFVECNLCFRILKFVHLYSWVWLDWTKDHLIRYLIRFGQFWETDFCDIRILSQGSVNKRSWHGYWAWQRETRDITEFPRKICFVFWDCVKSVK